MQMRTLSIGLATLVASAAITGCGSSSKGGNGVASKPPTKILAASQAAADKAHSVHVSGSVATHGATLDLDLEMVANKGAKGKVSEGGLSFELIRIGNTAYISGSSSFYKRFAGPEAAKLLNGKWLKAPATNGEFATLGSLTDLRQLLDSALTEHGTLKKGSTTTVHGHKVVEVKDATHGGTLYVATTGKPYPIEIAGGKGSTSGTVTFSSWNAPVKLAPPKESIDITKLKTGA